MVGACPRGAWGAIHQAGASHPSQPKRFSNSSDLFLVPISSLPSIATEPSLVCNNTSWLITHNHWFDSLPPVADECASLRPE